MQNFHFQSIGPRLSISRNFRLSVCLSVRVSVRLFTFEVPFNSLFAPTSHWEVPKVGCPIFLEIRNPWGKVMGRSGLTFEHFWLEVV